MKLCQKLPIIGIFMLSLFSFAFSNCVDGTDVCLSLDGGNLNYNSSVDIAGFQFNHDGCVTGATGGDAAANGFTTSATSTVVLAFSFTGSVIPAGEGTLVVLDGDITEGCLSSFVFSDSDGGSLEVNWSETVSGCMDNTACNFNEDAETDDGSCWYVGVDNDYCDCDMNMNDCAGECGGSAMEDCTGECNGSAMEDCLGECNGSAVEDACGECGGDATDPSTCIEEGYSLSIGEITDTTLEIIMNNEAPVAGFQFALSGVNITDVSGGSAEASGFTTSAGATGTVLGFSFTGSTIPAGNGLLTLVTFDSMDTEVCITDVVLSDYTGEALDAEVGDCYCGLVVDCAGECGGSAVEDCAGECNGDTVIDCAGECGGSAMEDCTGECNGDAAVDCAGVCEGTADLDVCGECDGSETDINNCFDSNELFIHSLTPTSDTTARLDVYMSNLDPVAGFEFRITSTLDGFSLGTPSDGSSENAGFEVATSASGMVLGFSFTGATIPYGTGLLTSIDVTLDSTTDMSGYIYLEDVVMADSMGITMDFDIEELFFVGDAPDAPDAPMNLVADVVEINSVDIGWDASENADYYTLYRNGQMILTTSTPGHFDTELGFETVYTYSVSAGNGAGDSGMSNDATVTTGVEPFDPIPPANLMAFSGDEEVTLTWEEPAGFPDAVDCAGTAFDPYDPVYSSYDCMVCGLEGCGDDLGEACIDWLGDGYCDDGSFGFDFTCETFSCDCGDCGFDCEDQFGFCGLTCEEQGLVECADGSCAESLDDCPEPSEACEDCEFDWTAYGAECCDSAWDDFGISCADLEANYNWDCAGCNCPGDGLMSDNDGYSDYIQVVEDSFYDNMSSDSPTSKSTGDLGDYSNTGSSNTQTREQILSYNLFMGTTSGGDYSQIATTSANEFTYTVTGLENYTEYFFVATAVYEGYDESEPTLESDYSDEASATPLPFEAPVPENLTASPGDNEVVLDWDSVTGREEAFVGYNVYRGTASGTYSLIANLVGEATTYMDSGLANGQMYYYVVTSQYEETESAYSAEATAQPMDFVQLSMSQVEGIYAPGDTFDVTISWENPGTIAGIQLVLEDLPEAVTMTNVEGLGVLAGEDLNAYSSDYNGIATILWFSLTGATLEAGEGELARVTFEVNEDAGCGSFDLEFSDDQTGTVFSDSNGLAYFWDGEGQSINTICDANLSLVQISDTEFEVHLLNTVDVAGFQFDLVDSPDNFSINPVVGTTDRTNGYMVSANASGTIIGFSIMGDTIIPGSGAIIEVSTDNSINDTEVCFENIVLADPTGAEIQARSECLTFSDDLDNDTVEVPQDYSISKIYPNPFNPSTTIEWTMKEFGSHRLDVYNTNGQLIDVISEGYTSPGYKQSTWDASNHASGIYIVRLIIENNLVSSNKVMLVK